VGRNRLLLPSAKSSSSRLARQPLRRGAARQGQLWHRRGNDVGYRSFRLNFEVNVEVCDAGLAAALSAIMAARRGPRITQSMLDARGGVRKMRDTATRLMLPYL